MDKCADLLPDHFRFVRGVVDSPDFSLNISREVLQHDPPAEGHRLRPGEEDQGELLKLQKEDREKYEKFWKAFGTQIKYGVVADYGAHKENAPGSAAVLVLQGGKNTTLAAYQDRMPEDQPLLLLRLRREGGKAPPPPPGGAPSAKGIEILYCTEDVDDFVMRALGEIDGKAFKSVNDEDALPQTEEEKKAAEEKAEAGKPVLEAAKEALGEQVKEVRASSILKSGAVCLTG